MGRRGYICMFDRGRIVHGGICLCTNKDIYTELQKMKCSL